MKKEKTIKTYQRKTKSGKMATVKQHTAKYDSAEEMAKAALQKKAGAGKELEKRKNSFEDIEKMYDKLAEKSDNAHDFGTELEDHKHGMALHKFVSGLSPTHQKKLGYPTKAHVDSLRTVALGHLDKHKNDLLFEKFKKDPSVKNAKALMEHRDKASKEGRQLGDFGNKKDSALLSKASEMVKGGTPSKETPTKKSSDKKEPSKKEFEGAKFPKGTKPAKETKTGSVVVNAKKSKTPTAKTSTPAHGVSAEEFKAWYHWDAAGDPKNKAALAAEKKLKAHMGAKAYNKYFDQMSESYSARGHNKAYSGLGGSKPAKATPQKTYKEMKAAAGSHIKGGEGSPAHLKMIEANAKMAERYNGKDSPKKSPTKKVSPTSLAQYTKDGDVTYVHKGSVKSKEFGDMTLYSVQKKLDGMSVSFSTQDKKHVVYSEGVKKPFTDDKSYKKHGGLIYEYRPLTDSVIKQVHEVLQKSSYGVNKGKVKRD